MEFGLEIACHDDHGAMGINRIDGLPGGIHIYLPGAGEISEKRRKVMDLLCLVIDVTLAMTISTTTRPIPSNPSAHGSA